jgi:hypothetical protein
MITCLPKPIFSITAWFAIGLLGTSCNSKLVEDPNAKKDPSSSSQTGGSDAAASGSTTDPNSVIVLNNDLGISQKLDAYLGPTEDANCGLVDYKLNRSPSPVMILQDRSSSMRGYPPGGIYVTKWAGVRTAIQAIVAQTEANVAWGLQFFPNETRCMVSEKPEIPTKLINAKPIIDALNAITGDPSGAGLTDGTPTNKAIDSATRYLTSLPEGKNKYIVLATDGQPSCLNDNPTADNYDATLESARKATASGIKIAVVGIAFNYRPGAELPEGLQFLNKIADLGGMPRVDPVTPELRYYPADNPEQLTAAFQAIAEQVISCTFTFPTPPPSKDDVAVKLNGTKLPRSTTEGWEYDSTTSLTLYGSYCQQIRSNEGTIDIKIIMGCPGVVIY